MKTWAARPATLLLPMLLPMLRAMPLLLLLLGPGATRAAPEATLVTILDGPAILIRDSARFALAEGVRLAADDIVETDPKARLLRIEFSDGAIVDLGPDTRLLLAPRFSGDRGRPPARFHLLQGWAKLTAAKDPPAGPAGFSTPLFDVTSVARSAVFSVQSNEGLVFAETGDVVLNERTAGKAAALPTSVKANQFLSRSAGAKAVSAARPTPAFLQAVPRPFVDTLPSRAAVMKARDTSPKRLGEIAYADVQAWLAADGLRPNFVARWKALAKNPEFRKGLIANLRAHPEWDRTLFPEKYLPKSTPAPAPAPAAAPATPRPATPAYNR